MICSVQSYTISCTRCITVQSVDNMDYDYCNHNSSINLKQVVSIVHWFILMFVQDIWVSEKVEDFTCVSLFVLELSFPVKRMKPPFVFSICFRIIFFNKTDGVYMFRVYENRRWKFIIFCRQIKDGKMERMAFFCNLQRERKMIRNAQIIFFLISHEYLESANELTKRCKWSYEIKQKTIVIKIITSAWCAQYA